MKKTILLLSLVLFSFSGQSQEIKPLRIGLKLGFPSLGTLNAEYVTPLWENRVAGSIDYMPLAINIGDQKLKLSSFEIGSNIYFNTQGRGFYGGLSFFSFNSDVNMDDIEFDNGERGDGKASFGFNTVNVKIGAKFGGTFYFRTELGYGFGNIKNEITFTGNNPLNNTKLEIPAIPGLGSSGALVFNIGFGVGFL